MTIVVVVVTIVLMLVVVVMRRMAEVGEGRDGGRKGGAS